MTSATNMLENQTQYDKNVFENLIFVRLKLPRLIPKELIDAVKGRTFTSEQFYKFHEENKSPHNFLYALIDKNKKIEGYLWAEVNCLDGTLFVNTFSISKKYWSKGKAIPKVINFLGKLKEETKAPRVFWITTNEKFFLKHGFKKSKNVLMEYNEDVSHGLHLDKEVQDGTK